MKNTMTIVAAVALFSVGAPLSTEAGLLTTPELWSKNCVTCHGKDGKGDTKAGLRAKVKDMTNAEYQQSFSNEKAFSSIKNGLKDGDRELMKPFHEKLSDDEIESLVAHVRSFAAK